MPLSPVPPTSIAKVPRAVWERRRTIGVWRPSSLDDLHAGRPIDDDLGCQADKETTLDNADDGREAAFQRRWSGISAISQSVM